MSLHDARQSAVLAQRGGITLRSIKNSGLLILSSSGGRIVAIYDKRQTLIVQVAVALDCKFRPNKVHDFVVCGQGGQDTPSYRVQIRTINPPNGSLSREIKIIDQDTSYNWPAVSLEYTWRNSGGASLEDLTSADIAGTITFVAAPYQSPEDAWKNAEEILQFILDHCSSRRMI